MSFFLPVALLVASSLHIIYHITIYMCIRISFPRLYNQLDTIFRILYLYLWCGIDRYMFSSFETCLIGFVDSSGLMLLCACWIVSCCFLTCQPKQFNNVMSGLCVWQHALEFFSPSVARNLLMQLKMQFFKVNPQIVTGGETLKVQLCCKVCGCKYIHNVLSKSH